MLALVVGGDGNVHKLEGGVRVADGDGGHVHVGSLNNGLGVGAGVSDDQETGLTETLGDVVGEGSGGETSGEGPGASVGGELEGGTLAVGAGGDNNDVLGVLDGDDNTCGQDDLLPGLLDVQDVNSCKENGSRKGGWMSHRIHTNYGSLFLMIFSN